MSTLDAGDVKITLDDTEVTLKSTLRAVQMISAHFVPNGLAGARQALVAQDFNAAVAVIRHGLNLADTQAARLPERVWRNFNVPLVMQLIRYVSLLANGGKPLPDEPVDDAEPLPPGNA